MNRGMSSTEAPDFFVSYAAADAQWAEWIAWQLEDNGYTTVIQAWDFGVGNNFVLEMDRATRQSSRILLVLSPASLESQFALAEWATAFRRDPDGRLRQLLPVRVRECAPDGLLGAIVYLDLVGLNEDEARSQLLGGLNPGRRKIATGPAFPGRLKPSSAPAFPGSVLGRAAAEQSPVLRATAAPVSNIAPRGSFTGRRALLASLASQLPSDGTRAVAALHGLGGVGKTRLALEYAYACQERYDIIWWIRGEEAATRLSDAAALAEPLGLELNGLSDQQAIADAVARALARLDRWLIVFDNVPGPDTVREFLPLGDRGHVLATSRRSTGWRDIAVPIAVDVFDRSEAIAYLTSRTGQDDGESAHQIACELGDLPLALSQAASYIDATAISLRRYVTRFQGAEEVLLGRQAPSDYEDRTVATTWTMAFDALERHPLARTLLVACAWLNPDRIPRELLEAYAAESHDGTGDLAVDAAIERLLGFSLLTVADADEFQIHRLVQRVMRWRRAELSFSMPPAVLRVFPSRPAEVSEWPRCERLLPHALAALNAPMGGCLEQAALLRRQVGRYLSSRARSADALDHHTRELEIFVRLRGPHDLEVARAHTHLARALQNLGELRDAREQHQRALAIYELHGPEHPDAAGTMGHLGIVLRDLGELEDARHHHEHALAINERARGPADPAVGVNLNDLGIVLHDIGDYERAYACLQRALVVKEGAHGPQHAQVGRTLTNLGNVLRDMGEVRQARDHQQRALTILEQAYGVNHPQVARALRNLAMSLCALKEFDAARAQLERALSILAHTYGPLSDHAHIVMARTDLRTVSARQGTSR
jgi:tetratricopeptide (TPR) repeat protein